MTALRWIWTHWYIPVLVLAGFAGFLFGARRHCPTPLGMAKSELSAVAAGERFRHLAIKQGKTEANRAADIEYRRQLDAMDARHKRKADSLRSSPARRARYLSRVSRKRPTDLI